MRKVNLPPPSRSARWFSRRLTSVGGDVCKGHVEREFEGTSAAGSQASIGSIADRGTSTWAASGNNAPWSKKKITPSLTTAKFW